MKVHWNKIKVGDFFCIKKDDEDVLIYQKIDEFTSNGKNAVLLNTGGVCCIYTYPNATEPQFQKVEVSFDITDIE